MKAFVGSSLGRYMILGLQKDDPVLESITKAAAEAGFRNAIVTSGVAAAYHMRWHHVRDTEVRPTDIIYETDGPIEVGGIGGLILNGQPHLHCTFADHARAWAGHLEEGCLVQYVGEITMIELLDVDVERAANEYGVRLIADRQERSAEGENHP